MCSVMPPRILRKTGAGVKSRRSSTRPRACLPCPFVPKPVTSPRPVSWRSEIMKKAACLTTALLLCLLHALDLAQETPKKSKDSDYTLNVNVNLVTLHVSVFDEKDWLIRDLKKDDFSVFE